MLGRSRLLVPLALFTIGHARSAVAQEKASELVEVAGTLVVEDEKGATVDGATGSITIDLVVPREQGGFDWSSQRVALTDGTFTLKAPSAALLRFTLFHLEDGVAWWVRDPGQRSVVEDGLGGDLGVPIPESRTLAVRARYAPMLRLHVVDATWGRELDHIQVVRNLVHAPGNATFTLPANFREMAVHPTIWRPSDVRARDATSPVALEVDPNATPAMLGTESLWVHAAGHCWGMIEADYVRGGDVTLRLAKAGSLFVPVDGVQVPHGTMIVARRALGSVPLEERASADQLNDFPSHADLEWPLSDVGSACFHGIPPDRYTVSLELGEFMKSARVQFATCDVDVRAGSMALAKLTVERVPAPPIVSFTCTLRVDPAWGDPDFRVAIRPDSVSPLAHETERSWSRRELTVDPDRPHEWKLEGWQLARGRYTLRIDEFGVSRELDVGTDPVDLSIDVARPVDVTLHFVDARTRAPVAVDSIRWRVAALAQDRLLGASGRLDVPPEASSTARLRVPAGRIDLWFGLSDDYEDDRATLDVGSNERDFTLLLAHVTAIRVVFRVDGHVSRWNDVFAADPTSTHGFFDYELVIPPLEWSAPLVDLSIHPSLSRTNARSDGGRVFRVPQYGEYRVHFPPIVGWEPIRPQDVTVRDQEFTDLFVDLVRAKPK